MHDVAYGYCHCGCGEKTKISSKTDRQWGYVKGEPRKWLRGHVARQSPLEYLEEDRGYRTPCWIWQRSFYPAGYGKTTDPNRKKGAHHQTHAHRVFYERFKGPIPEGLHIDHLCRVRACVNPDHLEPVTCAENTRRGALTKLTRARVHEIRASSREQLPELAEKFGLSVSRVEAAFYAPEEWAQGWGS